MQYPRGCTAVASPNKGGVHRCLCHTKVTCAQDSGAVSFQAEIHVPKLKYPGLTPPSHHHLFPPGDSKADPSSQKLEESAVTGAMCRAFHSLDEAILAEARSEGLRDGATALVVMRLGDVLYAAHAGERIENGCYNLPGVYRLSSVPSDTIAWDGDMLNSMFPGGTLCCYSTKVANLDLAGLGYCPDPNFYAPSSA